MTIKLTHVALLTLPEGEYPDALMPGLLFRPGKKRKPWVVRYRLGGKRHNEIIGYFPGMSLLKARETAGEMLKRVESGQPPQPEAERSVHPQSSKVVTVGALLDRYEAMRRKEAVRLKSFDHTMKMLRGNLADHLATPLDQFRKAELKQIRDRIFERAPIMSNRFMAYFGPVMKYAAQEELIDHNFLSDLRKGKERKRDRVLTNDELRRVWHATHALDSGQAARSYGRLVRFLMLTMQRLDEGARVVHGDVLDGHWRFLTKGDKPHRLKLPRLALDQLGAGEARDLSFPGKFGTKLSGWSKLKTALDKAAGLEDWRLHDLRRSGATKLQELGYDDALIHYLLNHSRQGLSAVYLHSDLYDRMGRALADWAAELTRIVGDRRAAS